MATTAKGYRYPVGSDVPNVSQYIQNLAQDVNDKAMPVFTAGKIYAYRTTSNQSIPTDLTVPSTVLLNATNGTPSNMTLNITTGVITVGSGGGGEYNVAGAVNVQEVGPSRVFASIFVNGSERLRGLDIINRGATSGDVVGSVVSGPLTLAAGDQVTLRALHTGSAGVLPTGVFINWMQLRRIS